MVASTETCAIWMPDMPALRNSATGWFGSPRYQVCISLTPCLAVPCSTREQGDFRVEMVQPVMAISWPSNAMRNVRPRAWRRMRMLPLTAVGCAYQPVQAADRDSAIRPTGRMLSLRKFKFSPVSSISHPLKVVPLRVPCHHLTTSHIALFFFR